jgi:hypothetical protein
MADMHPLDPAAMKGIGDRVETVTHKPINSLNSSLGQGLDQFFCHSSRHDGTLLHSWSD